MDASPLTKAKDIHNASGNECTSDLPKDQPPSPCRTIPVCGDSNGGDTTDYANGHSHISIKEENDLNSTKPLLEKNLDLEEEQQPGKKTLKDQSDSTTVRLDGIILDVLNSTTIHVDWCPIANNEAVSGYKIRYAARDNSSYNEIFVTPGISSYTITGLRPNTEYDISVNAVDDRDTVIQTCGWVRQKTDELEDGQGKKYEAPYLTAAAAIALLLVAVVVPITFLFLRNCGQCSPQGNDDNTALPNDKTTLDLPSSFRHRNDFTKNDPGSHYKTLTVSIRDTQTENKVAQQMDTL